MNFLILALTTLNAQAALPSIKPALNSPICLVREYSRGHMRRNPKQKLSAIYIKLHTKSFESDDHIRHEYDSAAVVGLSRGQFFGNDGPSCQFAEDGSAKCQVDCDGGSFGLVPRPSDVLMQITKDYYFPLFRNGANPEDTKPGDTLSFDGNDVDNNAYSLRKVDVEQCERAIRAMKKADFGC